MASTSDIRNGLCIEHNHDIFKIVEFQHVKPGKGAAFVRTKLKSLTTGRVLDNTFPAGHKIKEVRVRNYKYQYLYNDDMGYHFMNNETYEQTQIDGKMIDRADLLQEGVEVTILFHDEKNIPLTLDLPPSIVMEITYTEPGVKGDTATNTMKPATVETGAEVRVPLFVNIGDKIRVDTTKGTYMERIKDK
ncbi:MAG: elongation factor P [Saprospiraceae bacterium]|jgi:elongation factor P|nr:elongation factor P [Saprospiraceae bacterium]